MIDGNGEMTEKNILYDFSLKNKNKSNQTRETPSLIPMNFVSLVISASLSYANGR